MYKRVLGRYRLQQGLLRSQHKNTPKQPQNRPSPKRAKGSTGDEAAVLRQKSHVRKGHESKEKRRKSAKQ